MSAYEQDLAAIRKEYGPEGLKHYQDIAYLLAVIEKQEKEAEKRNEGMKRLQDTVATLSEQLNQMRRDLLSAREKLKNL